MNLKTFGFIGCGNMGGALAASVARTVGAENLLLCDKDEAKASALASRLGASTASAAELVSRADCIFLGVKPQMLADLLSDIREDVRARRTLPLFVTMAAGLTVSSVCRMLDLDAPVVRIMPNTPVSVGEGMILYTVGKGVSDNSLSQLISALGGAGRLFEIAEEKIDAASAVSGCGPAFAYLFIEALADAGVECGLARADAITFASQMLLGSARLVLESGQHPGALKDAVCSPGGTTIAGVHALEEGGFRAAAMNAVVQAYKRTLELKK